MRLGIIYRICNAVVSTCRNAFNNCTWNHVLSDVVTHCVPLRRLRVVGARCNACHHSNPTDTGFLGLQLLIFATALTFTPAGRQVETWPVDNEINDDDDDNVVGRVSRCNLFTRGGRGTTPTPGLADCSCGYSATRRTCTDATRPRSVRDLDPGRPPAAVK